MANYVLNRISKYVLNLNKTKMYGLISEYRQDLPKMYRCEFSRHGTTYRMEYAPTSENYYRICVWVLVCMGRTSIRIIGICSDDAEEELYHGYLSFNYLQDHGLVKEVV